MIKVNYVKFIEKLLSYGFAQSDAGWKGVSKSMLFTSPQSKKSDYSLAHKYNPAEDAISLDLNYVIAIKDLEATDLIEYTPTNWKNLTIDGIWVVTPK